jgi:proline dehydrogenase
VQLFRSAILAAAGNDAIRRLVTTAPISRSVARRFVAGEACEDAVAATRALIDAGLSVSLDHLGEDAHDEELVERAVQAYLLVLKALHTNGFTRDTEVSVKLSALGQHLDADLARVNAGRICAAAWAAGTTVTIDMEDHTTTDATLETVRRLRADWPATGAVLQAYLRRTEDDCRELSGAGSRVRLCKGSYAEPEGVAFTRPHDVNRSFLRCANVLLAGPGYPMLATHDPTLLRILEQRVRRHERAPGSFEYQMLYGVRPDEQRRLVGEGHTVRVYVPYGVQWYAYLVRRLAERPANLTFFARALMSTR